MRSIRAIKGWGLLRWRHSLAAGVLVWGVSIAQPVAAPQLSFGKVSVAPAADFSVMTYNVAALPWPIARGRDTALRDIAARLAGLRSRGAQPTLVVLQEAFTDEAKAIGERAGYRYRTLGPAKRDTPGDPDGSWYLGESQSAALDSGLVVLSDLPVMRVERAAFPSGACAGYDCLAAKGVLLVTVALPDGGEVTVATTHLNSRKASGAAYARTHVAYGRQVDFLTRFLAAHRDAGRPMVLAGDFNRGDRPVRIAALAKGLGQVEGAGSLREGLRAVGDRSRDADWIRGRARDMQFLFDGRRVGIEPVSAEIPFGTEADGSTLSDHMGFTIRYRLVARDKTA